MTAENQIENSMLSIAKKSVLKTLCPYSSFDVQFPKLELGLNAVRRQTSPWLKWVEESMLFTVPHRNQVAGFCTPAFVNSRWAAG